MKESDEYMNRLQRIEDGVIELKVSVGKIEEHMKFQNGSIKRLFKDHARCKEKMGKRVLACENSIRSTKLTNAKIAMYLVFGGAVGGFMGTLTFNFLLHVLF